MLTTIRSTKRNVCADIHIGNGQYKKVSPKRSVLDSTDEKTPVLGSQHVNCPVDAVEYEEADWEHETRNHVDAFRAFLILR